MTAIASPSSLTSNSLTKTGLTKIGLGVADASQREQLSAAAKQFEAIFVRQVLASARKADFGGEDLFGGQALDTFREMQDNHFAEVTAGSGVLGFAARIEAQIARFLPLEAAADTSDATPAEPKAAK